MVKDEAVVQNIRAKLNRIQQVAADLRFNYGLLGISQQCQEIESLSQSIAASLASLCPGDWGGGGSWND
jgi:hypothetical protein